MAEANIDYLLDNAAKVNWLKGVLVMEITDEAVRPFVETEMIRFHKEIKANYGLCGSCTSTNAKYCPRGICSDIMSKIKSEHRYSQPCYTNSVIAKWLSDPWEIAKCYMSRSKDLEGKPECDLDYASILNVVINNTRFERLTGVNMADDCNVFIKGRVARNKTMHSRWHETTDPDLKDYCDTFIEIVKLTVADSEQYVKKIKEVRDTPLLITNEKIVKLKEMAARSQEMTEEIIEKMKTEIRDEAKQLVKYLKDEAEKVNGTSSMMANFIEGCKESLYNLTVDHIRQQKPDDIKEDEWTIKKFVECLRMFPEKNSLSPRHFSILFRKTNTEEDIRKWDPFLFCFILQIELHVPVTNNVLLYVKDVLEVRDELLHNGVAANELLNLCDYLDEPLKSDIQRIFNKKYTRSDTSQASVALISWCGEERDFNNKPRYLRKDVKKDQKPFEEVIEFRKEFYTMKQKFDTMQQEIAILKRTTIRPHETNQEEEMIDEGATSGIAEAYVSDVEIVPTNVSPKEEKLLQRMMTSFKHNNDILNNGEVDHFKNATGCMAKCFKDGSIILQVECPSVEQLVGFWKGCTDGTVVKAMSKIRDAYRRYLENDKLEFDIVLKKKEVTRRRNKIIEDLKADVIQFKEQMTDVNDLISRPDVESFTDLQPDTDPVQTSEIYTDDEELKTRMTQLEEQDPVKPPPETFTVGEAGESDTESLGLPMKYVEYGEEDVKSEEMIVEEALLFPDEELKTYMTQLEEQDDDIFKKRIKEEALRIPDAVRPKIKLQEMPSTSGLPMEDVGYGEEEEEASSLFKLLQFGTLVVSKMDAISKLMEKAATGCQEKPIFEPSAVKTSVSIAEDTEVDESEIPRPQATKIFGKHREKGVKSSMVSDTEDVSFKPLMTETDVYMKSSVSAEYTSEDDLMKKKMHSSSVPTHQSLAKGTDEQAIQGIRSEEPKS